MRPTAAPLVFRIASLSFLGIIAVVSAARIYLRFVDSAAQAAYRSRAPESWEFTYEVFLNDVEAATPAGAAIALRTDATAWNAYAYRCYRAWYVLAGRTVVPMIEPEGPLRGHRHRDAEYEASWNVPPSEGGTVILRFGRGVLQRIR